MKKENLKEILIILLGFILILVILGLITSNEDINLSKLSSETGYQICTQSINTNYLICTSPSFMMETYNSTPKQLNEFTKNCNGSIKVSRGTHCIGNRFNYYNGTFYGEKE